MRPNLALLPWKRSKLASLKISANWKCFSCNAQPTDRESLDLRTSRRLRLDELREKLRQGPILPDFTRDKSKDGGLSIPEIRSMLNRLPPLEAFPGKRKDGFEDSFGRKHTYLRISLTERCNLRCKYCMPEHGVPLSAQSELLSGEEMVQISKLFVDNGVTKIRLTGGEPLVRKDIVDLASQLSALDGLESLGITTNGLLLTKKLDALHNAGVTHVNISLDTLDSSKFESITRRKGLSRVLSAIDVAIERGYQPVKVNCVVMRDFNLDEVEDFVEFTRHRNVDVRFIEWMPFDSNRWNDKKFVPFEEMLRIIRSRWPDVAQLPHIAHDTAKSFKIPSFRGKFGFITSMTDNFCSGCNRLRMTADGNLKVCLFGTHEVSLRDVLRAGFSQDEMSRLVCGAVYSKHFSLGGHKDMHDIANGENRPMILIGG